MKLERRSHCKVNLLLNVLGRRPDGFHDLETLMQPVALCDTLTFERGGHGIALACNDPRLPVGGDNLVCRAAEAFFSAAGIKDGVRIRLAKEIPLAAGLGGGSGNAAVTLLGLNELFGQPLAPSEISRIAAGLGSDVPFFLQSEAAIATGRGERIELAGSLRALDGCWLLLIHPGFGISTPWAYQQLRRFPDALNGRPGRAARLAELLSRAPLASAATDFYNALEGPALEKYPILALYQEFLRKHGATVCLMSGSGSSTFALTESEGRARELADLFRAEFGPTAWLRTLPARAPCS